MLLVRSFERTERIRDAMVSRGYSGRLKTLDDLTLCWKDFFKAALAITGAIMLSLSGWMG
jgi:cobalt/nickel transport system permease protein